MNVCMEIKVTYKRCLDRKVIGMHDKREHPLKVQLSVVVVAVEMTLNDSLKKR